MSHQYRGSTFLPDYTHLEMHEREKQTNMLEQNISEPEQLACRVSVVSFHGAQAI